MVMKPWVRLWIWFNDFSAVDGSISMLVHEEDTLMVPDAIYYREDVRLSPGC